MHNHHRTFTASCTLTLLALAGPVHADGSEALGAPSIALPTTGDIVLSGVGLLDSQPATFTVAVPEGRSVARVLAYWEGLDSPGSSQGATDTILIDGQSVTGERIGGATNFFKKYYTSAYRADLTALGLVTAGDATLTVEGLDYTYSNNGLGLVVVLDDEQRLAAFADGLDYAHGKFAAPYDTTEPVAYHFDPADEARAASVHLLVSGVAEARPSAIEVRVDGALALEVVDALHGNLGHEIDALDLDFEVPAGASEVTVRVLSEDRGGEYTGNLVSSLTWLFSGFTLANPTEEHFGCDPSWWAKNWWRWDPWCTGDNVTDTIDLKDDFNATFGTNPCQSGLWYGTKLWNGLTGCGWGWWLRLLNREAVAALANADSDIGYPYTVLEVIALYRDAVGADCGPETLWTALEKLYAANRLGCPF